MIRTYSDNNAQNTQEIFYILTDHLNTPRKLTDSNGVVVWGWNSDAFGVTSDNTDVDGDGTKVWFRLRFPGQYYDFETGEHYNYFRDYEPSTGRYLQSDPIGLYGGINSYEYVFGNPLRYLDPLGEVPQPTNRDKKKWTEWLAEQYCGKSCQQIHKRLLKLCQKMGLLVYVCKAGLDDWVTDCIVKGPPGCNDDGSQCP